MVLNGIQSVVKLPYGAKILPRFEKFTFSPVESEFAGCFVNRAKLFRNLYAYCKNVQCFIYRQFTF